MAKKILFINQEITPYVPENAVSNTGQLLPQKAQEAGCEIRTFTPKWGTINERKGQLHEVIRLSGMNLVIDEIDHSLIIKVASIPVTRLQVYFIDNDDYFNSRKMAADEQGKEYEDNGERAIFYARGVLETVRKLNWAPTVVHCMGWMSAVVPIYMKKVFNDDPLFRDVKIVVTLADDRFDEPLDAQFAEKIANEGVKDEKLSILSTPSYENLYRFVIDYADGITVASPKASPELVEYARQSGKPVLEYREPDEEDFFDNYNRFYEELQ